MSFMFVFKGFGSSAALGNGTVSTILLPPKKPQRANTMRTLESLLYELEGSRHQYGSHT